jgi:hypothetical protein
MPDEYLLTRVSRQFFTSAKGDNFVELSADLRAGHAEDCSVNIDVLPACKLRMESGTDSRRLATTSPASAVTYTPAAGGY